MFCCPKESAAPSPVPPKSVVPTLEAEVGVEAEGFPKMLPEALVGELKPPLPPPPPPPPPPLPPPAL